MAVTETSTRDDYAEICNVLRESGGTDLVNRFEDLYAGAIIEIIETRERTFAMILGDGYIDGVVTFYGNSGKDIPRVSLRMGVTA
jgi:histidyl-tRNA synthetase